MKRPNTEHYEKLFSHPNGHKFTMNSEKALELISFIKHLENKIKELEDELKQQKSIDEYDPLYPPMGGGAM